MDLTDEIVSIIAAASGWVAAILAWRRARSERIAIDVDAEVSAAGALREARKEVRGLDLELEGERERRDALEHRCASCEAEVARLKAMLQAAMLGLKLDSPNPDVLALFDEAADLWALTSPTDRGSFIWISRGWRDQLGIEPPMMLGSAWRSMVTAETMQATANAEAVALSGSLSRFSNRYACPGGRVVTLLWWSTSYDGGSALCFARIVRSD